MTIEILDGGDRRIIDFGTLTGSIELHGGKPCTETIQESESLDGEIQTMLDNWRSIRMSF